MDDFLKACMKEKLALREAHIRARIENDGTNQLSYEQAAKIVDSRLKFGCPDTIEHCLKNFDTEVCGAVVFFGGLLFDL